MTNINRRTVLRGTAATGLALAMPAILKAGDALASSGTVNVFAWGDYVQDNIKDAFEKATGIKVNLSTYGSNDEAENKLRAAGGKGFDVIFPSVDTGPNYYKDDLLGAIDESKFNVDKVIPSIYRASINLGATNRGKRYLSPCDWGTEAITFDSAAMPMDDAEVSFGAMWSKDAQAKATFRQKSGMVGVGLYLDSIGEVKSNRMLDVYKTEEEARRVYAACADFIIAHKANVAAFWNNATEATNAYKQAGATIGQTWDTTGLLLNREDAKYKYRMPKEGGITWMDSMGIPTGAENVEQAYAFINAMLDAEMAGMFSKNTGYNSAVLGAADHAGDEYKAQFNEVYNADNLANLWWWQADQPWTSPLVGEFVDKITNS